MKTWAGLVADDGGELSEERLAWCGPSDLVRHARFEGAHVALGDIRCRVKEPTKSSDALTAALRLCFKEASQALGAWCPTEWVSALMRGEEGEAENALRRMQGDLLRDHAAHRHAHEVEAIPAKRVRDVEGVTGHVRHRPRPGWARPTLPDAAIVQPGQLVTILQTIDLGAPKRPAHPKAHEQKDLRTRVSKLPVVNGRLSGGKALSCTLHGNIMGELMAQCQCCRVERAAR